MTTTGSCPSYVLITPARNEEAFIEKTITSVIGQTVPPLRWVIVDDGSSDGTAAIVERYLPRYPWMEMIHMPHHRDRSFAAKVHCFNAGYERVRHLPYDVIGNLDADLGFDEEYCEFLLGKFRDDPALGVAGTIFEEHGYSSARDGFEGQSHVAGGCQLFRRRCFEDIGGYVANRAGGIDWIAVTTARMRGWTTRSYREKSFFHHRSLGTAERGRLRSAFSYGEKDYYLGGHPVWELFRATYRMSKRPYILNGLAVGLGYAWAWARRIDRAVSDDLMRFHRAEQLRKLRAILQSALALRRPDHFLVTPGAERS
jgi:glycosyltransferase involved in cell wall biosynthesis